MAQFDPVGAFQGARQNALAIQAQEAGLRAEAQAAPVRNQLAQIQLQEAQAGQRRGQVKSDQAEALQRAKIVNNSARALLNLDPSQWEGAVERLAPELESFGIPAQTFRDNLTPEGLQQAVTATQGLLDNPNAITELGLKQRTLDIREKELSQRGELLKTKPEREGEIAKKKLEAQLGLKGEIEEEVSAGKARGKETETRLQETITKGLSAADSTATIRRGMQLLESIETGGVDRAALGAKQFFGVESAEEGELSNLLGKAVLGQLRETFGAAFTAKEGESLRAIDANIGKSPAANRRLLKNALKIAERAANRGIDRAVEAKDFKTAAEIQEALDFVLEDTEQPTERQGGQVMIDAQGNRARVFDDGTFEEL